MTETDFGAGKPLGPMTGEVRPLADDLLRGAGQIAKFVFGDPGQRRKIYHLAENSQLPVFRLGSVLCARKSVLLAWVAEQDSNATGDRAR